MLEKFLFPWLVKLYNLNLVFLLETKRMRDRTEAGPPPLRPNRPEGFHFELSGISIITEKQPSASTNPVTQLGSSLFILETDEYSFFNCLHTFMK